MKDKFKKFLPHIAAIIFFLGLSLIFFSPIVTENKTLHQGDLENMTGWGKDLIDYNKETGEYAFWSNSMFSGMPANFTYMPPFTNIFDHISRIYIFGLPINHIGIVFIYLLGFYIFMMSLGCKPLLSIVGAVAYAFTSYNLIIIEVGHVNKALVMATMAPIIAGVILCYRKKYLWGIITTFIFTGINAAWGHSQISYYLLLMIIILAIVYLVYAIKEKTLKDYFISSGILAVVAAIAITPSLGMLISTADYAKDTMRGGSELQKSTESGEKKSSGLDIEYAFGWSYGKAETMTLLIPNFYGGRSNYNIGTNSEYYNLYKNAGYGEKAAAQQSKSAPMYWGDQPGTSSPYAGAIVCFLCILGLLIVKGPEKWWLLGATILSLILAWGKNFGLNEFIFNHLPLYNKFRSPTMALAIAEVTMVTLSILALKEIFNNKENRKVYLKPIYISAGITGGLCLFFALLGSSLMTFSGYIDSAYNLPPELVTALVADRKSMLMADSWRSLAFIALATGAIWYYINNNFKTTYLIAIIGILIFTDLWTVGKRHLNYDSFVEKKKIAQTLPTEYDNIILQDNDPNYRVLNMENPFNESATSYFHKSIGGYSPAKLQRYQDIMEHHLSKMNLNVLNMLNTKYIIFQQQQGGQKQVQLNQGALGNVWFVDELKWVDTPNEEIAALNDFNPAQTASIHKEWQSSLQGWEALQHEKDSTAYIRMTDYANPGNIFYESSSTMPHLAVFSEVHYKTWHAYIDGKEVPVVRVNYILRGLEVPAGNHKIEFKCIDDIYLRGAKISMVSSTIVGIVILCLVGFAILTSLKRYREKTPASPLNKA